MRFDPSEDTPRSAGAEPEEDAPIAEVDAEPVIEDVPEPLAAPVPGQRTEDVVAVDPPASAEVDDIRGLRDAEFPLALRGYNTHAVDRYVHRVERCIAQFEEHRLPTEAVRRALDRVGEQTSAILREAERSAEETTRASRARAEERLQQAEREATALWTAAQERARQLDEEVERLWQERQRLIEATRKLANRLHATANEAEATFPPEDAEGEAGAPSGRRAPQPDA